jgi:hypothetical protein
MKRWGTAFRSILVFVIALTLIYALWPVEAQKRRPLPAIPSQSILNKVIRETGGPTFTSLGVPAYITNGLATFTGVFSGAQNMFSASQTVHYITTYGELRESVLPLVNSRSAVLDPDITAPGTNPLPGKIIAATFQPTRGTNSVMIVVAVFKPNQTTHPPSALRFYYNSTQYYESKLDWGRFSAAPGPVDEGSVIAYKNSCTIVGIEQVCWSPYSYPAQRDSIPGRVADAAYTQFRGIYDVGVTFYTSDALPDLIGAGVRNQCAGQLSGAGSGGALSSCIPNLVFAAAKEKKNSQPIALFVVNQPADLKAYRADGTYTGLLPAGQYLVIDATPYITTPGAVGVLFLVNADTRNHYLIPSAVVEGFGDNPAINKEQGAIKDGFARRRSF